jgi:formylglycine-generating enzyme required for sulfatase activity
MQADLVVPMLPELIVVAAGSFLMGSETGRPDERPRHRVRLRPFALARLPVGNAEYARFIAAGQPPPRFWNDRRFNRPEQPVVGVRWEDAVAYCAWLTHESGRRFRLPTEAEWEYAASGGDARVYPWGDGVPERTPGLSFAAGPLEEPASLGKGPTNPLGIGDLGWNVHEWCSDWYSATYYADSPEDDPHGPSSGTRRASRGGAWRHQIPISRCAARSAIPPAFEYGDYGFRVCAEPRAASEVQ